MTATSPQAARDRALGRGVAQLIPATEATPAGRAAAALAALRTVPVPAGVLQAALALLEDTVRTAEDEQTRQAAESTVGMLRAALDSA